MVFQNRLSQAKNYQRIREIWVKRLGWVEENKDEKVMGKWWEEDELEKIEIRI